MLTFCWSASHLLDSFIFIFGKMLVFEAHLCNCNLDVSLAYKLVVNIILIYSLYLFRCWFMNSCLMAPYETGFLVWKCRYLFVLKLEMFSMPNKNEYLLLCSVLCRILFLFFMYPALTVLGFICKNTVIIWLGKICYLSRNNSVENSSKTTLLIYLIPRQDFEFF